MGSHRKTDNYLSQSYHNHLIGMCFYRWTMILCHASWVDSTFNLDRCAWVVWCFFADFPRHGLWSFPFQGLQQGLPRSLKRAAECIFKKHVHYFVEVRPGRQGNMRFFVPTIEEGTLLFLDQVFVPYSKCLGFQFGDVVKAMHMRSDSLGSPVLFICAHCSEPFFLHDIPIQNCVSGRFAGIC